MTVPDDVAAFGSIVAERLASVLGDDLVGAWFIGSIALDGFVPGESDIDIAAMCRRPLALEQRRAVIDVVDPILDSCPARGLEMTVHLRGGGDWQVNVNGGPRMEHTSHLDPATEPSFWWTLDRAIAITAGIPIVGPPAASVFPPVDPAALRQAMAASLRWHRAHEGATLYSVLNASRAWRYAVEGVLGSKLAGAAWARERWPDPALVDAAVDLRHGRPATLDPGAVDALLAHVVDVLERG